jgi:hypothetical protein
MSCIGCHCDRNLSKHSHETIPLRCPFYDDDEEYPEIDKNISELISELWKNNIETSMSCENNVPENYVWIEFPYVGDFHTIMDILFNGKKFGDKLYEESKYTWIYNTYIDDINTTIEELDDGEEFEENSNSRIFPILHFSWRFPKEHYDEILKRFKNYKKPSDISKSDIDKIDKFIFDVRDENLKEVKKVITKDKMLDINSCHSELYINALMIASKNDNVEVAKYLLSKGADVNYKNIDNENALMFVCQEEYGDHKEIINLLIDKGTDTQVKNYDGQTVMDLAKTANNKSTIKYLKQRGVKN